MKPLLPYKSGPRPGAARREPPLGDFRVLCLMNTHCQPDGCLEYGLKMALEHRWSMSLLNMLDLDKIGESDSRFAVEQLIQGEVRRVTVRLESLKEIMEAGGLKVDTEEMVMGSVRQLADFDSRLRSIEPGLIVVGRKSFTPELLDVLVRNTPYPFLIVPDSPTKNSGSSILLYADGKRIKESALFPLLKFAQATHQKVDILSTVNLRGFRKRAFETYLPAATLQMQVNYFQQEGSDPVTAIDCFIKSHPVNILAIILRNRWWMFRVFSRWTYLDLARRLNVPLLVFKMK